MSKYELGFFDPFYDDFDDFFRFPKEYSQKQNMMRTDIKEHDNSYELDVELPGVKKEDIDLSLHDGYLTVSYEHKEDKETKEKGKVIRRERFYGSSSRSFYVGDDIKEEDIEASYDNGVLTLNVPKQSKVTKEVKKIAIK